MMDGDRWSVKQYKEKRDCQKADAHKKVLNQKLIWAFV